MPEMGVSILCDGVGKPFSVRPAADDTEFTKRQWERRRELHFAKFVVIRIPSLEETPNFHSHIAVAA